MFTGIITDLGKVKAIALGPTTRLEIATAYDTGGIALGASVACNGCCLSVVEKGPGWMAFEASRETLDKTTMGDWKVGHPVNLERRAEAGRRAGRPSGLRPCRWRRPHPRRSSPMAAACAS